MGRRAGRWRKHERNLFFAGNLINLGAFVERNWGKAKGGHDTLPELMGKRAGVWVWGRALVRVSKC